MYTYQQGRVFGLFVFLIVAALSRFFYSLSFDTPGNIIRAVIQSVALLTGIFVLIDKYVVHFHTSYNVYAVMFVVITLYVFTDALPRGQKSTAKNAENSVVHWIPALIIGVMFLAFATLIFHTYIYK